MFSAAEAWEKCVAMARTIDPQTSHDAAAKVDAASGREKVLAVLIMAGPMCDETLVQQLDGFLSPSGARTRRSELVKAGLVRDSGRRGTTAAGRETILWEAV